VADSSVNTLIKVGLFGAAAYLIYKQGWLAQFGIGTAPATTPATATTAATTTPAAAAAPSALDTLYTAMVAAATAGGISTTGPDGWNYYLVQGGYPSPAPDPADVFPGVDRSIPMTSAQYWAGMSAWLQKNKGMSGVGIFGGLAGLIYCGGLC
jgi:hypothetical protein